MTASLADPRLISLKGSLETVDYGLTNQPVSFQLSRSVNSWTHFVAEADGQVRSSVTALFVFSFLTYFQVVCAVLFFFLRSASHTSLFWLDEEGVQERERVLTLSMRCTVACLESSLEFRAPSAE